MNLPSFLSTVQSAPPRFIGVTILGWACIAIGTLGLPISVISFLMFLTRSYGTANASLGGALLVIGGPLALLVTGVGLLLRQPWAHVAALLLVAAFAAAHLAALFRGSTPTRTFTDAHGTKNTIIGSTVNYPYRFGAVVIAAGVGALLLGPRVRSEFWRRAAVPPPLPAMTAPTQPGSTFQP